MAYNKAKYRFILTETVWKIVINYKIAKSIKEKWVQYSLYFNFSFFFWVIHSPDN